MKNIEFAGHTFILDPLGLMIWPEQKTAIVADLHLEKGSYFALGGQMLPQQESIETLEKLHRALEMSGCGKLILLGDSFHDEQGFQRLSKEARSLFDLIKERYEVIWIVGNHDGSFVPEGMQAYDELDIENITFRHEAVHGANHEISGHYHPKAILKLRGTRVSRPCFVANKNQVILPAFGALTGGMDVTSEEISNFFEGSFDAFLLGQRKIYKVSSNRL